MRLFVAVDVPNDIKEAIEHSVVDVLRPALDGARWTRPEGRHLTLKFLGEVPDDRVEDIASALGSAVPKHRAFDAAFASVGGFPNLERPRVLWVGVGEGADAMTALANDIEEALVPLGFEAEARGFHAHVTLARFPKPGPIGDLPAVDVPRDTFNVTDVHLFRSQLHPKGARYSVIASFKLAS